MRTLAYALIAVFVLTLTAAAAEPQAQENEKVLGVIVELVTAKEAEKLGLDSTYGLRVTDLMPKGTAENAGIKAGDVLLAIDGIKLTGLKALDRAVKKSGLTAKVAILRDDWEKTVTVKFPKPKPKKKKPAKKKIKKKKESVGEIDKPRMVQELNTSIKAHQREIKRLRGLVRDLRGGKAAKPKKKPKPEDKKDKPEPKPKSGKPYIGVSIGATDDKIVITGVDPDGPAAAAGIKSGDVLVGVGGKDLAGLEQLGEAIKKAGVGGKIIFNILREQEKIEVSVTIGAKEE
jgi:S1-C subfamily serine protease